MRRTLITVVVAGLALAACGTERQAVPQAGDPVTATPLATSAPAQAEQAAGETLPAGALDFSLPDVNGGQVEGASLQGRDLALWFWAPW